MSRLFALLMVVIFSGSAFCRSSEIPAKREFPVNPAINPCTDFYKYACSKVDDSFELRADRSRHDFAFNDSFERILDAKKKYFAQLAGTKAQNKHEAMLKSYYLACMNEKSRAKEEKAFVKENEKLVRALDTREALLAWMSANDVKGETGSLNLGTDSNQDRPLYNDLVFTTGWLSLPEKSYYEKPEVVADLEAVVSEFFKEIGDQDAAHEAHVVVEFEKGLAKDYLTPTEFREVFASRTGISRADLLAQYPNFKLQALLERVPQDTHIRHIMPKAMANLNTRLGEMPLTDLKAVYLYNFLSKDMDDAYPVFFKKRFDFENKDFGGPAVRPARNERCTREAMGRFTPELDSILWTKIFPNFPREKFVALSEKIRAAIASSLKDNKWLSPQAKQEAIKKITTANLQLISPQTDEEWNFHPEADYDVKKPVHNAILYAKLMTDKELTELKGPISPKRWGMGPLTINAYYDDAYNKFVLPVGILQYPFYDVNGPLEPNLAAVGTVIGHELGHGIDDKGSRYDASGKMRTWMSEADLKEFKKRSQLLVEQFNHAGHNGELTLGENIGDLVGLTASHLAAFGPDYKTSSQAAERAFFTQYARLWCEVQRPKYAEKRLKEDPHSLSVARVNEQIKQQPTFRKAFQCKDTDAMVLPQDKLVKIW